MSSARRHAARHRTFLIPRTAPNAPPKPTPQDAFRRRPARVEYLHGNPSPFPCSPTLASLQARIRQLRYDGMGVLKIGKKLGIGTSVVQRVLSEEAR
jgi:hypothetical protein